MTHVAKHYHAALNRRVVAANICPKNMPDPVCSNRALAKLKDASFRAQYLIKIYASSQETRPEILSAELSKDIDIRDLQWLINQFEMADFSALPTIEVHSRLALGGAWSQYVPEINTVYLAGDFVEQASKQALITVLLREIIDAMKKFV